jgi:hypothetical protein
MSRAVKGEWTAFPLKIGPTGYTEKSVNIYQRTPRKTQQGMVEHVLTWLKIHIFFLLFSCLVHFYIPSNDLRGTRKEVV